ncbi:MAG: glutaminyl-peptide cyclotransferase [Halieaceae bacterium]|jgi:glutamine cyclotransferase|nr:glutaminyl-peptide cyclotransferase [Halieaceae bacterium]
MPCVRFLSLLLLLTATSAGATDQYHYRVLAQKALAPHTHVQGLEIVDGKLYASSGGYGKSKLLRFDFATGELQARREMDSRLWAEGLTVLGDRVYQLTWRARQLLVYDKAELKPLERMRIPGEGWGMTNDGEQLIYSDGSDRLFYVSPAEHRITRVINVRENGEPVTRLNELEWIDDRIWANVWLTNRIVIIDPASGAVEASVDLGGLLPLMQRPPDMNPRDDVLNGIARDPVDGGIWVTGKNWPFLYRIELVPTSAAATPGAKTR